MTDFYKSKQSQFLGINAHMKPASFLSCDVNEIDEKKYTKPVDLCQECSKAKCVLVQVMLLNTDF